LDPRSGSGSTPEFHGSTTLIFQNLIGKVEAGVETAATAAAISLPDLEAVALGLNTLRHNLPVSGQLKGL
jgi:hypothetical protein